MGKRTLCILALFLGVHLFLLYNLEFTAWPEMLSYPYLRNQGFLLYRDMIHPYPPVLTITLSIIYRIFGYKLWIMKTFAWSLFLVNDILVFLIVKKLTNTIRYSLFATVIYVFLQPFLEGNMLWFDTVLVAPVLLAVYLLLDKKLFWSGVFLGISALIKQTAGLFLVVGGLWVLIDKRDIKELIKFYGGPAILLAVLVGRLLTEGALLGFLNWTLIYPFKYWSAFPGYVQMGLSIKGTIILLLLFSPLVFLGRNKNLKVMPLSLFLLVSIISVYPRFSFFHLQTGVALLVIYYGVLIAKGKKYFLVFPALAFFLAFYTNAWTGRARFYQEADIKKAQIIASRATLEEKVFLLGENSSLYAIANRLPPKPWSDNFGWYLEIPGIQEEIIKSWEQSPPKYVFWREPNRGNWYDLGVYQPEKITEWLRGNYQKKELAWEGTYIWQKE